LRCAITRRRLVDVLLTPPRIRSIRRGFPRAELDVMVFRGSEGILKGNPDIDEVITLSERPLVGEGGYLMSRLWRRYDLVVSTQAGDRPTLVAMVSGRHRVSLVPRQGATVARSNRHGAR